MNLPFKKYRVIIQLLLFFITLLVAAFDSRSQGFLKAKGRQIVNESGQNVLLRGIGLGGWMLQEGYMLRVNGDGQQYKIRERIEELIGREKTNEFYDAWLSNFITKADIDSLKAWGFNSIRLPMHYRLFTLSIAEESVPGQNTWLKKGFDLTDSLLAWCSANGIYLILDMHAAPGGQGNDLNISDRNPAQPSLWEDKANQQKMIALWKKLAQHYANEPWIGGYDIINEPNWGFENPEKDKNGLSETLNEPLRKLMMDITTAIREVDTKHLIIIEGNGWGNNYKGILPPWDDNMVLSFHKYWNFNSAASIQEITGFREQYNIPIWLGETGENSNVWFTNAIRLVEKNNIGWAWWPLKKLGLNNPLQIPVNPGYQDILQYWRKGEHKPDSATAYQSLMQLARQTNNRHNLVHYDVIDAMIRQPHTDQTLPYVNQQFLNGGVVNAVDYDLGKNGFAYYDSDSANYHVSTGKRSVGNRGNLYRNDAVDINEWQKEPGKYYVADMEKGEWLQYSIQVTEAGVYHFRFKVSASEKAGKLAMIINGKKAGDVAIPVSDKVKKWETVSIPAVSLKSGLNQIRVLVEKEGFEFSEIEFSKN